MGGRRSATVAVLVVGLLALDALLLAKADRQLQIVKALRRQEREALSPPAKLKSVAAVTSEGVRIFDAGLGNYRAATVFVLHAGVERTEAQYWERVRGTTRELGLAFLGCCERPDCSRRIGPVAFPVVPYPSYELGRAVALHDRKGQFILVDRRLSVVAAMRQATDGDVSVSLKVAYRAIAP